jgi:cation/acetate symporter
MVLANPEIANLPNWVIAGSCQTLAAALSTAAGLLLISASVSHDIIKK